MVRTDPGKTWNLSHIFQAWKVLESGLGPAKYWKVMEMRIAGVTHFMMISQTVKNFGHIR